MNRSGSGDQARLLQEATYENLRRLFRESPDPVYGLRQPGLSPCALGESHIVDGLLQAVTLIYGSWDQDQPHIRVTTWRDLPGQDFIPDAHDGHDTPDALLAAPPENVTVAIDGRPTPATLRRLPAEAWLLRAAPAPLVNLLASGRGPIADLTFASLPDLEPALAARHACLASRP